jgi:hypothetical protein
MIVGELPPDHSYDCTTGKLWQLVSTDLETYLCLSRLLCRNMVRMLTYTTSQKQHPLKCKMENIYIYFTLESKTTLYFYI